MTGSNEIVITRAFDAPRDREALITMTVAEHAGTAKFTLRHAVCFDRLAGYLATTGGGSRS